MDVEAAAAYARRHELHALLVRRGDAIVYEHYENGWTAEKPHALYSGTKSFWGPAALAAEADGLLQLDEPVGATFPEWSRGEKAAVTLRHLLTLTSGIGFGGLGAAVPVYEKALAVALKTAPGTVFTYGGIPLQVFGAVLAAKLASRGLTPHAYLRERILEPHGVEIGMWRSLADGTQPLPTGAFVTARAWAAYGAWVCAAESALAPCFTGTAANPRYGLGWWLDPRCVYASGAAEQALYVVREANAVIVKFGKGSNYKHDAFLKRLLT